MSPAFVGLNPQLPNTGPTGLRRPGCRRDVRHNVALGVPLAHRQQQPPVVFHTSESGRVSGWNLNLSPAVFSFVYAAADAQVSGRGGVEGHPAMTTATGGGCISPRCGS
jgi:hypothetical protein